MTTGIDEIAHQNLVAFTRWMANLEDDPKVLDDHGVLAVVGDVDWPASRLAVRSSPELAPAEWVARADDFLRDHGDSACVFVREGSDDDIAGPLEALGYAEYARSPEMVCEAPLPDRSPAAGIELRLADSTGDMEAFAAVAAQAFAHLGILEHATRGQLSHTDVLLADDVIVAVAARDRRIVAGALCLLTGDARQGYVGWVSCADDERGLGLGDAVTRTVTNEAFARGASAVTLEASKFGESTYRRMGYRELYHYRMLIRLGSPIST